MSREYQPPANLPKWLKDFADKELQKEGDPFQDIRDLFNVKSDIEAVEAKVKEIRDRVGLDQLKKESSYADDKIKGGLADGKNDKDFDPKQIEKGIKVEMEHTDDKELAKEIAKDHLMENSKYYDHLEKMEEKMDKEDSEPEIFKKYPQFKNLIHDALSLRGGFIDVPAVLDLILDSKAAQKDNLKFSQQEREELRSYIKQQKEKMKSNRPEEEVGVVVFVIDENTHDDDKMFDK